MNWGLEVKCGKGYTLFILMFELVKELMVLQQTGFLIVKYGVKQGCPLSAFLFSLIINNLTLALQELDTGVRVNGAYM